MIFILENTDFGVELKYPYFLGLVMFSLVFGVAIASVGEESKPVLKFFEAFVAIMMKLTSWIINLAPIGVLFLVAGSVIGNVKQLSI